MGRFPPDFVFGVATAAYQIEGAVAEGGRVPSHWDTFSHTPGNTVLGATGDIACDHYHRYKADIRLLKEIGVSSYRFSLAWPRIQPGPGVVNRVGLDFYRRLLDELDQQGIRPAITLYHWDLPEWLAARGGWVNRDTAAYFRDYAALAFEEFGDRRVLWITHNEPWCAAFLGYALGEHAPGHRDWREAVVASHHLLVSHGLAVETFRQGGWPGAIGITLNLTPAEPATDQPDDRDAARRADGFSNRWFLDPLFFARYPDDMLELYRPVVKDYRFIRSDDLAIIAHPMDFLGINYYTRSVVKHDPGTLPLGVAAASPPTERTTAMGWEIHPASLYQLLKRIQREYGNIPVYITENGAAFDDRVEPDGTIHDERRIAYLAAHLEVARQFVREGGPLKGYYIWSFLDNFEWALGYTKRFGIMYVDYVTEARLWKDSARWFQAFIRQERAHQNTGAT